MKVPPKPKDDERKKDALQYAIALFEANAVHANSGPWYVAYHFAQDIFEEMQRGEMDGFNDVMA